MNKKPNMLDYGITEESYRTYCNYKNLKRKKEEIFFFDISGRTVLIGFALYLFLKLLAAILVNIIIKDEYGVFDSFWGDAWQYIGLFVVLLIISAIIYSVRCHTLEQDANKVLNTLSTKQIEMIKKYEKDVDAYNLNISNLKNKYNILKSSLNNYKKTIEYLAKNTFELNTRELIDIVKLLNSNYKRLDNSIFDFSYSNYLIKIVGIDSFISNVDIQEMNNFIKNKEDVSVIIYTLVPINENLLAENRFQIVDKEQIKSKYEVFLSFKEISINKEMENTLKELRKYNA